MKIKKSFLIICIIICLISFSSVTAININDNETTIDYQTNSTDYIETADDTSQNFASNLNYDSNEYDQKLGDTDKTYYYLQDLIDASSTVDLQYDISYSSNSGHYDGIKITNNVVINGNGHYIDGKNKARAFYLMDESCWDVTLINFTFKNCKANKYGGVIFSNGYRLHIINCTFENNYAADYKGTEIYGEFYDFSLIGSKFTYNNQARDSQGAINIKGNNFFISDCDFYNNTLLGAGIVINGRNIQIQNCNFNSYGKVYQPITITGVNVNVSKCNFIDNNGGGICFQKVTNGLIKNCYFVNNYRYAVVFEENSREIVLLNSTFENNNYTDIIWDCKFGDIISCRFIKENNSRVFGGNETYCNLINNTGVGKSYVIKANKYNEKLKICFKDVEYYKFDLKPVKIDIGPYHYEEKTDEWGQILLDLSNIKEEGRYYTNIYFEGTSNEDACSLQTFLNIGLKETKLIVQNIISYQPDIQLKGKVCSQNYTFFRDKVSCTEFTIPRGNIVINCNNQKYIVRDGEFTLNLNLNPGIYDVTTFFEKDSVYASCNISSTITVLPSISLENLKSEYENNINFNANFLNTDGNRLKYEYILFNIDGVDNILITDENGVVNFNKQFNSGTHTFKIINTNTKEEITTKIIVKSSNTNNPVISQKTILTLKSIKVKKSAKKLVLQATLKQGNNALSGKKIIFKFNGKKYTAKTNKNGVAKVTIKKKILKILKVSKKVKYQASYGKITVKKSVKVKK